jgi:long-chain acyl-CoA synthetase
MLRASAQKWPDRPAMVSHKDDEIETLSYTDLMERVRAYAGAVSTLGLERGDRICIQSENCIEWALTEWACQCLGLIVVPIYPTLPAAQSQYILSDCGAKVTLVGGEDQAAKSEGVEGVRVVQLRQEEGSIADLADRKTALPDVAVFNKWIDAVDPTGVANIIYTSGTTGNPKGAMLAHTAFTDLCESVLTCMPIGVGDVFLCYLPMSHIYERAGGQVLPLSCGATIAFAQSLRTLAADMSLFKPTVVLCVPRVLEAMRDKVMDGVAKMPALRRALFNWGYTQGIRRAKGQSAPFFGMLDRLVGAKVREKMGGHIRFYVSGGSALPPTVAEFYLAMGFKILQGYGLTETTAITCLNRPDRIRYETIGEPIPCVEIKIADDGELLVRGPSRMIGYYNKPEATAEAIDADGWFHTGDIGAWDGAQIRITDRKKDIIVLGNGKNVAPQPIEDKLRESQYIDDVVLFGDGKEYISGIVVPDFGALRQKIAASGVTPPSDVDIVDMEAVRVLIKSEITRINQGLADFEKVKKHSVLDHPFSIEGGELTPTLKVRRRVVKEKYKDIVAWLDQ